jgi:pyruvate dehydrogenase E2 component (dihydrolipoamide acetyltransferase)
VATELVHIPDMGSSDEIDVIEICVKPGDTIALDQSLIVLESAKASMEVPSTVAGRLLSLKVKTGDKVVSGSVIAEIETDAASVKSAPEKTSSEPATTQSNTSAATPPTSSPAPTTAATPALSATNTSLPEKSPAKTSTTSTDPLYAGPAVRKLARELGIELRDVKPGGPRNRITQEDVQRYVKHVVQQLAAGAATSATGSALPPPPSVDYSRYGQIDMIPMTRIDKITRDNMHRSWLHVPHVTQFDHADVTNLEEFRAQMKAEMDRRGIKLTPVAFLLKACANAIREQPRFNRALHTDGEHFVQRQYVHIGIAVDTPMGLMVPVVRDVDKKGLWEIASEVATLSGKARNGKLLPGEISGGCFTISSLGAIGGEGFTPIVNLPEVAILGVSRTRVGPVWDGTEFQPRKLMPLTLSYDHRVINGADAGRFLTFLTEEIGDIRRLLL